MVSRILAAVVGLTVALTVSTAAADTSHVVVESHDGGNYSKTGDLLADNEARAQVARKFYATHADSYDFLVVFPTFDADFGSDVGGIHWTVRNSEAGINQPVTNLGAQFGSPSRLKGFVDMAQLMPSAGPTATDQALDVVAHEVAHQWSGAVRYKGGDGAVRTDLIGRDSAHWSFFLNSDASVLYGSNWRANGDGTFTATEGRKRYSALDLYLMGFLSAAEVPAFTLLHPDSSVGFRATDLPLQVSTTIKATPETVTISQVIAAEGERVPSVEGATKVFRAAFIILSAPGSQPTEDQLAKVDSIRRAWANHFFFLTRGRGVMETDLVELPPGTLSSSPSVNAGLDYLLSRQLADGSWSDSSATSVRDTQTALEALAVFPADPRSPVAMTRAASYLGVATLSDTDAIARAILGLVAAHSPTGSALGLLALPADPFELLQPGASSLSKGYSDCVIDAILAGKAKLQAGVEAETVTATTAFALAQQNADGGWSFTVGGPSRVEPTAHVLDYLSGLPRTNDVSAACGRALQFIESRKNSSGAFADDLLAPATTARSVLALQNWERLNSTDASAATSHLLSLQQQDGSWEESANQTAVVLKALRVLLAPNLVVKPSGLAVSRSRVSDGEAVPLEVRVHNRGAAESPATTLQAYDSSGRAFTAPAAVPTLAAGGWTDLRLVLDTLGHGPSEQVFAVVDPGGDVDETREDDNRAAIALEILPPPSEPDLLVIAGSIQLSPSAVDHVPTQLTVTAQVRNVGTNEAAEVEVALVVGGVVVGRTSLGAVAGFSGRTVTLTGSIAEVEGQRLPVLVVVDPDNVVTEADETNNTGTSSLPIVPTVDLEVLSLQAPSAIEQGGTLPISFMVANHGAANAVDGRVEVRVFDPARQTRMTIGAFAQAVGRGVVMPGSFDWKTNLTGNLIIEVEAFAGGEVDATNNLATVAVTVAVSSKSNLFVRVQDMVVDPASPLEGATASLTVTVTNSGQPAGGFAVDLYKGDPANGGALVARKNVEALGADATASLSFDLPAMSATSFLAVAVVDPDGTVEEFDEADNRTAVTIAPLTRPDLFLASTGVGLSDRFPVAGATVTVIASVTNLGGQATQPMPVELFLGDPDAGGTLLATTTVAALEGHGQADVRFPWDTTGLKGTQELWVVANKNQAVEESRYDNNRASVQAQIQEGSISVSPSYFSPNGDGVKDVAHVFVRLDAPSDVELSIKNAKGKLVRKISVGGTQVATIDWDGRDDEGRSVRDGTYKIIATAPGGASVQEIGSVFVTLDTNRMAIYEAPTALLRTENVKANLSGGASIAFMPDDSGVVFFSGMSTVDGYFFQPVGGGGEPKRLTPEWLDGWNIGFEDFGLAISPDGGSIAFFQYHGCSRSLCYKLKSLDLATGAVTVLWEDTGWEDLYGYFQGNGLRFSPDGSTVLLYYWDDAHDEARLEAVSVVGGARRVVASDVEDVLDFSFSPDGKYVAYVNSNKEFFVVPAIGGIKRQLGSCAWSNYRSAPNKHAWLPATGELAVLCGDSGPLVAIDPASGATRELQADAYSVVAADPLGGGFAVGWHPPVSQPPPCDCCNCDGCECNCDCTGPATTPYLAFTGFDGTRQGWPLNELPWDLRWSPNGTFVLIDRETALLSLANQVGSIAASKRSGDVAISFSGTSTDLNYDFHEIRVKRIPDGVEKVAIRSDVPVENGLFGKWTPPGPGVYEATLVATDLAGNVKRKSTKFGWSDRPAIAAVSRVPEFISPNNDGVQDVTVVSYSVIAPTSADFEIYDSASTLVRTVVRTHLEVGTFSFDWDGTDDHGVLLPDGDYLVKVEGNALPITIDTTPPAVDQGFAFGLPNTDTYISSGKQPGSLVPCMTTYEDCRREIDADMVAVVWKATDAHLAQWTLEASQEHAGPVGFAAVKTGNSPEEQHDSTSPMAGRWYRLRASDRAGNEAVTAPRVPREGIKIAVVADATAFEPDPVMGGGAYVRLDSGTAVPEIMGFPGYFHANANTLDETGKRQPVRVPANAAGTLRPVTTGGLGIWVQTSIAKAIATVELHYRPHLDPPAGDFMPVPISTSWGSTVVMWPNAASVPMRGYDVLVRATDVSGRIFEDTVELEEWSGGPLCTTDTAIRQLDVPASYESYLALFQEGQAPRPADAPLYSLKLSGLGSSFGSLPECRYRAIIEWQHHGGPRERIWDLGVRDFCAVGVYLPTREGTSVRFTAWETLHEKLAYLDAFLENNNETLPLGTARGFEQSAPLQFSTSSLTQCKYYDVRIVPHRADGSVIEMPLDSVMRLQGCPDPSNKNGFTEPCEKLLVEGPSRLGTPTACVANVATYRAKYTLDQAGMGAVLTGLEASIESLATGQIFPLPISGFSTGSVSGETTVETALFAEGQYLLHATGTTSSGVTLDGGEPLLIVDRTPPVVTLSNLCGQNVCASSARGLDGSLKYSLDVRGHLSDANLEAAYARVRGRETGTESERTVWGPKLKAEPVNIDGLLATFDATELPDNDYDLVLDARDVSGGSTCSEACMFHLMKGLTLSEVSMVPSLFSPDGDGQFDLSAVYFNLSVDAEVEVSLEADGESLGIIHQGTVPHSESSLPWSGLLASQAAVPDGAYVVRFKATSTCGDVKEATTSVELDTTPPVARIDSPLASAVVGPTLQVLGEASDLHLADYSLAIGAGSAPASFEIRLVQSVSMKGAIGTLDTSSLAPGDYTLLLTAHDAVGHESTASRVFTVRPSALVSAFAAAPGMISPNADGIADQALASLTLLAPCDIRLDIVDGDGQILVTPVPLQSVGSGNYAFPLDGATLAGLVDGDWTVRVTANDGFQSEEASASLVVDTVEPSVVIARPVGGSFVAGSTSVDGSVADGHLASWELVEKAAGNTRTIASGVSDRSGMLAGLEQLADGQHELELRAADRAGNTSKTTVAFASDATPPTVAFVSPLGGTIFSAARGPVEVRGRVDEANLKQARLLLTSGGSETTVLSVAHIPADGLIGAWDLTGVADGPATLRLEAEDLAGNLSNAVIDVEIDSTMPLAQIESPTGYITSPTELVGTAADAHLREWALAFAPGSQPAESQFVALASGASSVTSAKLASLSPLPADGPYTLRLKVKDAAGNEAEGWAATVIDTAPPSRPTGLVVSVVGPSDVSLSWNANSEPDLQGYRVLRASGAAALASITGTPVATEQHLDPGVPDGTYKYAVVAVDLAGHESVPSEIVEVVVDTIPPTVALYSPSQGSTVSGAVDVKGMAFSATDLKVWRLSVGEGAAPADFMLLATSSVPVKNGVLGRLDPTMLESATLTIRLTAEDLNGNVATTTATIQVDDQAPSAPVLVSAVPSGSTVSLTWLPNPEADLKGYLLFRNGTLANLPDGATFSDFGPYLLPPTATSYSNTAVPDGTFSYELRAMDRAGNLSEPSNSLAVTLDNHAPVAAIQSPLALDRLKGPVTVVASTPDQDIAQVQVEMRPAAAANFVPLGPPRTQYPYIANLSAADFASPIVELRAVATDLSGNTDPAPKSISVIYEADIPTPSAVAHVDGDTVTLELADANPTAIGGYDVLRDGESLLPTPSRPTGTISASSAYSPPGNAYDQNTYYNWRSLDPAPQSWQIEFPAPLPLSYVQLMVPTGTVLGIDVKVAGTWMPVAQEVTAKTQYVTQALTPAVFSEGVRCRVMSSPQTAAVIYEVWLDAIQSTSGTLVDTAVPLGTHLYTAQAQGLFGATASASSAALVYAPTLQQPEQAVGEPVVALNGSGAVPKARVSFERDGVEVGSAVADSSGNFVGEATLAAGDNSIVARAVDGNGNRSLPSNAVSVLFRAPPSATIVLTLDGVTASDVALSFVVSGNTSDVTGYHVRRTASVGGTRVATVTAAATAYTDSAVANGEYVYEVAAINSSGLEGTLSNSVEAVVNVELLPPPQNLTVAGVPAGEALSLAWNYQGATPAGFLVERALAVAGPFAPLNATSLVQTTSYLDQKLVNGTTYFYRVKAVDAAGNPSAPSNVAPGLPRDLQGPERPIFTAPTVAGQPLTVTTARVDIEGAAERFTTVQLLENGTRTRTVVADGKQAKTDAIPTQYEAHVPVVTDDGKTIAYSHLPPSGQGCIGVETIGSASARSYCLLNVDLERALISPDHKRMAIQGYDRSDYSSHVYVTDLATGSVERLTWKYQEEYAPVWSPDSTTIVYSAYRSGVGFVVRKILGGRGETILKYQSYTGYRIWALTPSGKVIMEVDDNSGTVRLVCFDPALSTSVDLMSVRGRFSSVDASLDFTRIAAAADDYETGSNTLKIIDLMTSSPVYSTSGPDYYTDAVFSPDASQIAYIVASRLNFLDLASSGTDQVGQVGWGELAWTPEGIFLMSWDGQPARISFSGKFRFKQVDLKPGTTYFSAIALDSVGNESPRADAIEITYDPSQSPDLAVSAVIEPAALAPGQAADAVVFVSNDGHGDATDVKVTANVLGNDGSIRAVPLAVIAGIFPSGGQVELRLPLDLAGLVGQQQLWVVVDPAQAIADADRSNNQAIVPFTILGTSEIALSLALAPSSVNANSSFVATAHVTNPGAAQDVTVSIGVYDAPGAVVLPVQSAALSPLGAGVGLDVAKTFATVSTLAGSYVVRATVAGTDGSTLLTAEKPLIVLPDVHTTLALDSSRATYLEGSDVELTGSVANESVNAFVEGASLALTVADGLGAAVWQGSLPVSILAPGAGTSFGTTVPAAVFRPGSYTATGVVVGAAGAQFATAATTFSVVGRTNLVATIDIAGTGSPVAVRKPNTASITATVRNAGSATAAGLNLQLAVIDPDTMAAVQDVQTVVGDLAAGATTSTALSVPTTALGYKVYAVALSGAYSGVGATQLASARFRVADGQAPTLEVLNLAEGMYVQASITPRVRASDDASGTSTVSLTADGQTSALALVDGMALDGTWSTALNLSPDGPHALVFEAADGEGNSGSTAPNAKNPVTLTVISDSVAPVVSIAGVADGELLDAAATPEITVAEQNLAMKSAELDDTAFTSGTPVTADGEHTLVANATDKAGNRGQAVVRFTIDTKPPSIMVFGVADGEFFSGPVSPYVVVTDPHLATSTVTLDGQPFASGTQVSSEGDHALAVDATDELRHAASASVTFVIDTSKPVIALGGFVEAEVYNHGVAPTFTATDEHLNYVFATLDGVPVESAAVVEIDGSHELLVTAVDLAGNVQTAMGTFTIDKASPVIALSGVSNGTYYRDDVTPVVSVTDSSTVTTTIMLNGQPFVSGTPVSNEGAYTLEVLATDRAGNTASKTVGFVVDKTPPVITVAGVVDGAFYAEAAWPTWTVTDANPSTDVSELDGQFFESGDDVTADGHHTLVVTATDKAGNSASATVAFTLDQVPPVITITGVEDGRFYAAAVVPSVEVTDVTDVTKIVTLNGNDFVSGTTVSADGEYTLVATATDQAGNMASESVSFTIDKNSPVITITGVSNGAYYRAEVTPTIDVTDATTATTTITLNGDAFASGTPISADGAYTLAVNAKDQAGNSANASVSFTVDKTPPVVVLGGFADGYLTNKPVGPTYSVTDVNIDTVVATLNGAPFTSGTTVSAEGTYTVAVVATDLAGNNASASGSFTIDKTPPTITITGVVDGAYYNHPVTPAFTAPEAATIIGWLEGTVVASGTEVTADGEHVLGVQATDAAGNSVFAAVGFTIDTVAPVVALSGFVSGSFVNTNVFPAWTVTGDDVVTVEAKLDGAAFAEGGAVGAEGHHVLSVVATDLAGNKGSASGDFTLDKTKPEIVVGGVTDGAFYAAAVAPTWSATDTNMATAEAKLDGQVFVSGTSVTANGQHHLVVTVVDKAGNIDTETVSFTIDTAAPVIAISGVADGAYYRVDVTPVVTITDATQTTVTITLNGQPFVSGTAVSAEGIYALAVDARDQAGNLATSRVTFTIDKTLPVIVIAGVSDGVTYNAPVTPVVTFTDTFLGPIELTLDGAAYVSGTPVSADGAHTLYARAQDLAGNLSEQTVHFTLSSTTTEVEVEKKPTHFTRTLTLVRAGKCAMGHGARGQVETFVRDSLGAVGIPVEVAANEDAFASLMRSGLYNTYLLYALDPGSDKGCTSASDNENPAVFNGQLAFSAELTELVHDGRAGLVMVQAHPNAMPAFNEVLGQHSQGNSNANTVAFTADPFPTGELLSVQPKGIKLKLDTATAVGFYANQDRELNAQHTLTMTGDVAAARNELGRGRSVTLGIDLVTAATPGGGLTLQHAVTHVTPASADPGPMGVAGVEITIAGGSTQAEVHEVLSPPLEALLGVPDAWIDPSGTLIEWQVSLQPDQTTVLRYLVRMPDAAGQYQTETQVLQVGPGGPQLLDTRLLTLELTQTGADLLVSAQALAAALPTNGGDAAAAKKVQAKLASVQARAVSGRTEAEANIQDLLAAVTELQKLKTVDSKPLRLSVDELIRYWEARWFAY